MFYKAFRLFFIFILVFGSVAVQAPPTVRAAGPWYVANTGNDGNDCLSPSSPCATINGAIGKASNGDTVNVAEGTYTGSGSEVILIDRDLTLSGGWDATFTSQSGISFVDGQAARRGVTVNAGTTSSLDRFILQNGNKAGGGGGVNNSGSLTLNNILIADNIWGSGDGGGIVNTQTGVITMNHTTITRNGNQDLCNGTAIWNQGTITANNSAIFENRVTTIICGIGSAVINFTGDGYRGTIILNNTTVSNNSPGGGIYNYGNLTLNNSTVSHNIGDNSNGPGGIYNSIDGILSINSSTIASNTSAGPGGGIFNIGSGSGTVTSQNSILAGNIASTGADCNGTLTSLGHNLVGDTTDCNFTPSDGDLANVDAKLGILIGSPAYHPLLPDSPAVDAGRPTGCTDQDGNLLTTDQRGVARTGTCDIGSYEFTAPGPASSLFIIGGDHQRTITTSPFPDPFQVAALDSQGSPVDGVTIDFIAPASGSSGTFDDTGTNTTSAVSDATGIATSSLFTANDQAGIYQVSASAAGAGFAHFQLEQVNRPANDDFANAEVISSLPFSDSVDITDATKESGEPSVCASGFQAQSVWYSFTPVSSIVVSGDMTGSSFSDTNLVVYQATGPGFGGLAFVGNTCFGISMSFTAQAGTTYYIQAERMFGGGGDLHINLQGIAAPANDNFADAIAIPSLPFSATVDNTGATAENDELQVCTSPFRTLWYTFTPPEDMAVRVDMQGSQVGGAISVFHASGSGLPGLTFLACSFSGSSTNLQFEGGQTYYLRVDSFFGQPGTLQFNLEQISPPANDNFTNAQVIGSLPFSATVNNMNATAELDEPQVCSFPFRSVWYTFTPPEDMTVRVDMLGSQVGGAVSIFHAAGAGLSNLNQLACAFDTLTANVQVEGGQTYYFRLDSSGQPGDLQIHVEQIFPPGNDNFADAQAIDTLPFSENVDNTNATAESGEPQNCSFPFRSVWYAFTPPQNMAVRLGIDGDTSGGIASLFLASGPSISDLTFLTCASVGSPSNILLEEGLTYYLRVDSFFGQPGEFQVGLEQIFPPGNDNFADAQVIGALPFNTSVDNTDATTEPGEPVGCGSLSRSVWYTFTPTENIPVRLDAAGSAVSASISVFLASGPEITDLSFLTCVGSNSAALQLESGKTYYLRVDSFGQGGLIQINLEPLNPPANDNLANADIVTALPFSVSVDITDATNETNEPQVCLFMPATVWYAFTPAETVLMRANTLGSSINANVNIYSSTGAGFSDLQFITCSGSSGNPSFLAEAGKTYYFQAGSTFGESGSVQLSLQPAISPANDDFADAVNITSLPFSAAVDVSDATIEPDEPQFCFSMPSSVWYSFTATETMTLRTDMQGSPISANVTVYHSTGEGFPGLQILQCAGFGSAVAFTAEAGETYYFQVGGIGQSGPVQFNLAQAGSISGRITDASTGAPLPGSSEPFAHVQLYRHCGEGCLDFINSQNADGEGRFSFAAHHFGAPLLPGEYEIHASAQFYQTRQVGPFAFSGTDLDLGDLALDPPAVIRGRVVDAESGEPLGAGVTLFRCDPSGCFEFVNSQNTDENGQFRFNSFHFGIPLSAGTYELEIFAAQHITRRVQVTIADGEDRDLGDVLLEPLPLLGSISGRLLDAATGTPILPEFFPNVELYQCNDDGCFPVNSMTPDEEGRFRFETDFSGNPLPVGNYQVSLFADQYLPVVVNFEIGEGVHHNVGDVLLESFPVRFSDVQPCDDIPASGGECVFSVKVTNGTDGNLTGKTWGLVYSPVPELFGRSTNFQIKDPLDLDLGRGRSKVFRFRFNVPANNSPYGSFLCPQVFVGEGGQAFFNTIGYSDFLFCVTRNAGGFEVSSPQANVTAAGTGIEIEPNNSCQAAQEVGGVSVPFVMNGVIDPVDVDFFRFTGIPGSLLEIYHEGETGGKGTLHDPLLGFFDSNCNLIASNDDSNSLNSFLQITVPEDGVYILAATSFPDFSFTGSGFEGGSYQLTVIPVPVQFSDVQICNVPTEGGLCEFSVRVTNNLTTKFTGRAWSMIRGFGIGSFVQFTHFRAGPERDISLDPGRSTVLRFRFQVRGSVPNGAIVCSSVYVGQNPSPLFNIAGQTDLFCFEKGIDGFTLLSQEELQEQMQNSSLNDPTRTSMPGSPKK